MNTLLPAPRVDLIDRRTGFIAREWYRFFSELYNQTNLESGFLSTIVEVSGDYAPTNSDKFLQCSGDLTINLREASTRTSILTITNVGTGTITVQPSSGELIKDKPNIQLKFQWTSIQLCPKSGGYVII